MKKYEMECRICHKTYVGVKYPVPNWCPDCRKSRVTGVRPTRKTLERKVLR